MLASAPAYARQVRNLRKYQMKMSKKILLSLSISAGIAQCPVWAHASLESAVPAKNAQLTAPPKEVRLHFNENLEANFSSIKVTDSGGKNVSLKKAIVDANDRKTLFVPLDPLKAGSYKVQWVGVGHDGHRRTGDFKFSVK